VSETDYIVMPPVKKQLQKGPKSLIPNRLFGKKWHKHRHKKKTTRLLNYPSASLSIRRAVTNEMDSVAGQQTYTCPAIDTFHTHLSTSDNFFSRMEWQELRSQVNLEEIQRICLSNIGTLEFIERYLHPYLHRILVTRNSKLTLTALLDTKGSYRHALYTFICVLQQFLSSNAYLVLEGGAIKIIHAWKTYQPVRLSNFIARYLSTADFLQDIAKSQYGAKLDAAMQFSERAPQIVDKWGDLVGSANLRFLIVSLEFDNFVEGVDTQQDMILKRLLDDILQNNISTKIKII